MEYNILGRTGLRVSVAGLGCGGHSCLGQKRQASREESTKLVREALDLGINFIDTAENYETEAIVGDALRDVQRDGIVISTRTYIRQNNALLSAADFSEKIDQSLRQLSTDYVDIYHFHGVAPADYQYARNELFPVLVTAKEAGKVRFFGITEATSIDPGHASIQQALRDNIFDVVMYAFHIMHQNARDLIIPEARRLEVGTLVMCAMRGFFANTDAINEITCRLMLQDPPSRDGTPLDFLVHETGASSLVDAAYRYARHEPGNDVVLFGTGNSDHLRANINALLQPPLPADDRRRIKELFGTLEGVGLTKNPSFRPLTREL